MLYLWLWHFPDTDFERPLVVDGFHGGRRCGRHIGFDDRYKRYSRRAPLILIRSVMVRIFALRGVLRGAGERLRGLEHQSCHLCNSWQCCELPKWL